jgi:glycerol-3-phosphate dehydrogenase
MFQNADGRIIFVIPYQDDFTLIGTTDRDYDGDPAKVKASTEEIAYLCASASEYLAKPVKPEDVVWTYSGVRPLYDDGASEAKAATRDYVFELDTPGGAPLLSIYGGKITTYRRLAEEALERLAPYLRSSKKEGWTGKAALPGGDMDVSAIAALQREIGGRSRPVLWRDLDGKRSQVPDVGRMGLHRRGRRVAPLQARIAAVRGRNRRPRRMDGRPSHVR